MFLLRVLVSKESFFNVIIKCQQFGVVTDWYQSQDSVMSSASSAVTYTSVYTDSEPGRVFWGADEQLSDKGLCSR
ncbi:hypothetical protein Tco_1266986 [Tanacetum coccineum]